MWRLDVSSEAELDIFEAALRYERERADLGFRFEAQVDTVFARVLENPFQFPEIELEPSGPLDARECFHALAGQRAPGTNGKPTSVPASRRTLTRFMATWVRRPRMRN